MAPSHDGRKFLAPAPDPVGRAPILARRTNERSAQASAARPRSGPENDPPGEREWKKQSCQPACKPGSVSGVSAARRPFLWDDPCGPPRATHPDDRPGERPGDGRSRRRVVPIRSCSRWGLPCRSCCQSRGGLLPHRFTLTPPALRAGGRPPARRAAALQAGRSLFCGTFPGVAPAGRYPAPSLRGARTFLPRRLSACDGSGRPAGWRPVSVVLAAGSQGRRPAGRRRTRRGRCRAQPRRGGRENRMPGSRRRSGAPTQA